MTEGPDGNGCRCLCLRGCGEAIQLPASRENRGAFSPLWKWVHHRELLFPQTMPSQPGVEELRPLCLLGEERLLSRGLPPSGVQLPQHGSFWDDKRDALRAQPTLLLDVTISQGNLRLHKPGTWRPVAEGSSPCRRRVRGQTPLPMVSATRATVGPETQACLVHRSFSGPGVPPHQQGLQPGGCWLLRQRLADIHGGRHLAHLITKSFLCSAALC